MDDIIDLDDIRAFIKDIKNSFYAVEKELNPADRYTLIKGVVMLRMKEQRLMTNVL